MGDASKLRSILSHTDMSAQSIQSSAGAMMRLYDRSAVLAVTEWRNTLQTCRTDQLLPLLYVVNEVLQTSKRNRGNKFLEAFSPHLSSSLQYICQRDGALVEKVRRTIKIWGDRRVFSMRFIGELLSSLDAYRGTEGSAATTTTSSGVGRAGGIKKKRGGRFLGGKTSPGRKSPMASPMTADTTSATAAAATTTTTGGGAAAGEGDSKVKKAPVTDDEEDDLFGTGDRDDDDDDNDEEREGRIRSPSPLLGDDDALGGAGGGSLLDVQVKIDKSVLQSAAAAEKAAGIKRRRDSGGLTVLGNKPDASTTTTATTTTTMSTKKKKRLRPKVYTTTTLLELLNGISSLDDRFRSSEGVISSIPESYYSSDENNISDVVGDELADLYRKTVEAIQTVEQERRVVHTIANERKELEREAMEYMPWLEAALKQDVEDVSFCDELEKKLMALQVVHADARKAREKRLDEEARQRAEAEAERRRQQEEAERIKSLENAMKEPESKPGMVWNKAAREYQYIDTDEHWRD